MELMHVRSSFWHWLWMIGVEIWLITSDLGHPLDTKEPVTGLTKYSVISNPLTFRYPDHPRILLVYFCPFF